MHMNIYYIYIYSLGTSTLCMLNRSLDFEDLDDHWHSKRVHKVFLILISARNVAGSSERLLYQESLELHIVLEV